MITLTTKNTTLQTWTQLFKRQITRRISILWITQKVFSNRIVMYPLESSLRRLNNWCSANVLVINIQQHMSIYGSTVGNKVCYWKREQEASHFFKTLTYNYFIFTAFIFLCLRPDNCSLSVCCAMLKLVGWISWWTDD